jgi:hypothetical protein
MLRFVAITLTLVLASITAQAFASTVYVYAYEGLGWTSNLADPIPPTSNRLSISLTLGAPLAPNTSIAPIGALVSYRLFDGANEITATSAGYSTQTIEVGTDATGQIVVWDIAFIRPVAGYAENTGMSSFAGVAPGPYPSIWPKDGTGYCHAYPQPCDIATNDFSWHGETAWVSYLSTDGTCKSPPYGEPCVGPRPTWTLSTQVVPIPPAVWQFGSALGVMGWMRRKAAA